MEYSDLKTTALSSTHLALKAKMAPFGGYFMPIQYEGIIREHQATRKNALFSILATWASSGSGMEKLA